ncbi:MAG: tetratricopeptide repeat protein [Pyrinomonadaceae bacterium]
MQSNKFHFIFSGLIILFVSIIVFSQENSRISQTGTIEFPKNGSVKIEVIETIEKPLKIKFTSENSNKTIAEFELKNEKVYIPFDFNSPLSSFARFRKLEKVDGLPQPLIQLVAVNPGGSDHSFWTVLFAEIDGKIRIITPKSVENPIQGGVIIGNLGKENGDGLAVYSFIWGTDEAHFGEHCYTVDFYKYDDVQKMFVKSKTVTTKKKYLNANNALSEFGFRSPLNRLDDFPGLEDYREVDTEDSEDEQLAEKYYKEGKAAIYANDDNAAFVAFNKAVDFGSKEPEVYFYLGQIYEDFEEYEASINSYSKALKLRPEYTQALVLRAYSYAEMKGGLPNAIKDSSELIRRFPNGNDGQIYQLMRAQFYLKNGEKGKAEEDIAAALRLDPDNEEAKDIQKQFKP